MRVSFVIPVRDDAPRLRACINSIARNTFLSSQVDVVVVDNGSKDASARVALEQGATVLLVSGSIAALRNKGAAGAHGDILAFVDADHEIGRDWIHAAISALSSDDVAAVGALCNPPTDATWVQRTYDRMRAKPCGRQDVEWLGSGNLAIKRRVFELVGGFDATLETCEDVDLCNRVRAAGYRIMNDSGLESVHLGDPATLRALFWAELWRGRDNLRVTLRGPKTFRHLRSALIPVVNILAIGMTILSLVLGQPWFAGLPLLIVLGVAGIRTTRMIGRDAELKLLLVMQCLAVALVYDVARALALVTRIRYETRHLAERLSHNPGQSHS